MKKLVMNNKFVIGLILIMTLFCGDTENDSTTPEGFDRMIKASSYFQQPEELLQNQKVGEGVEVCNTGDDDICDEDEKQEPDLTETEATPGGGSMTTREYNCTVQKYKAAPGFNELFLLSPTADVIYPGSIIEGSSIRTGEYKPIVAPRKPLNVSVSIIGVTDVASQTVENPTLSGFRTARVSLLGTQNTADVIPPNNTAFSVKSIYSSEQLGVALGAHFKGQVGAALSIDFSGSLDVTTSTKMQKHVARFVHKYYTIDIDLPTNPSDFFEEVPDINPSVSPVYVSSITYGRMILFELESNRDETHINAAANLAVEYGGSYELGSSIDVNYSEVLASSSINATVIGGSQVSPDNKGACSLVNNLEALRTCIRFGGLKYQDALPLSYTLRFLSDNSIARVVLASEYNVRECDLVGETNRGTIRLLRMRASSRDETSNNLEVYGYIAIRPTSEDVTTSTNQCNLDDILKEDSEYIILMARPDRNDKFPGSISGEWQNFDAYNYAASYIFSQDQPNLEVCAVLKDRDKGSSINDDTFRTKHIIRIGDLEDIAITDDPRTLRIEDERGDGWIDIGISP